MVAPAQNQTVIDVQFSQQLLDSIHDNNSSATRTVDIYAYAYVFATFPDPAHADRNVQVIYGRDAHDQGPATGRLMIASFDEGGTAVYNDNPTLTIDTSQVATQLPAGQVYVLIQQVPKGQSAPLGIGDIDSPNDFIGANSHGQDLATLNNLTYQLIELSLENDPNDQGDISAANTFGLATELSIKFTGVDDPVTRGFAPSANDLFATFNGVHPGVAGTFDPTASTYDSAGRLAEGPAGNLATWTAADWTDYLGALIDHPDVLSQIEILGWSGGGKDQAVPTLNHYRLQYVPADSYGSDYFWLIPDTSYAQYNPQTNYFAPATDTGWHGGNTNWIQVTREELAQNIYTQSTALNVHVGGKDGPGQSYPGDYGQHPGFTPNTPDGNAAAFLVAGFDAGYWGTQSQTGLLNFNQTFNWDVHYAYGAKILGNPAMVTDLLGGDVGWDKWAEALVASSNAYGYSYSDLISAGGVSPLIPLWDTGLPGGAANVANVTIKVFAPGETPSGYQAPPPLTVLAGTVDPTEHAVNAVQFNFGIAPTDPVANKTYFYQPDPSTEVTLTMTDSAGPADIDIIFDVPGNSSGQMWGYYQIYAPATAPAPYSGNPGWIAVWTAPPANNPGTQQPQPIFVFYNTPLSAQVNGDYQPIELALTLGSAPGPGQTDHRATYHVFLQGNSDKQVEAVAVDRGVQVLVAASGDCVLNATPGGRLTFDPALFAPMSDPAEAAQPGNLNIRASNRGEWINAYTTGANAPTAKADNITGSGGNDRLSGLAGNDTIYGGNGKSVDYLYGNDGDDTLLVAGRWSIADWLDGGDGLDTLKIKSGGDVTLSGFDSYASRIEAIIANGQGIDGRNIADFFDLGNLAVDPNLGAGLSGVDGRGGNDILRGSNFTDVLLGGMGNDELRGRDGDDTLDGGAGIDSLYGGNGADRFVSATGYGLDTINDFTHGTDKIDLSGYKSITSADVAITVSGGGYMISVDGTNILNVLGSQPTLSDLIF